MTLDSPPSLPRVPRLRRVDPASATDFDAAIAEGAEIIRAGGLVAFPTETVYGLGANALDPEAVARIFAAKGRPTFNPIIVHIADASALRAVARDVPPMAEALARAFWPGPLTLVLPRVAEISDAVSAGLDSVGVRVPAHPVARALIERSGVPIAAPSANPYTRISPTTAAHVMGELGAVVDLVLDGGACRVGIESTVVDVTGSRPILLRPGGVSRDALERIVGPVDRPDVIAPGDTAARPAPGMVERHYAPVARLFGFRSGQRAEVWQRIAGMVGSGQRVGVVAFDVSGAPATSLIAMPHDPEGYARALYATLHTLDREGCTVAFVEELPEGRDWEAIRDRVRRAGLHPASSG